MLEDALQINLDLNDNKTVKDIYESATDCIQYCKSNYELVGRYYMGQSEQLKMLKFTNDTSHLILIKLSFESA